MCLRKTTKMDIGPDRSRTFEDFLRIPLPAGTAYHHVGLFGDCRVSLSRFLAVVRMLTCSPCRDDFLSVLTPYAFLRRVTFVLAFYACCDASILRSSHARYVVADVRFLVSRVFTTRHVRSCALRVSRQFDVFCVCD